VTTPHLHHRHCGCGPSRRSVIAASGLAGALALGVEAAAQPTVATPKKGPWVDAHVHLQAPECFRANVFERQAPRVRRRASPAPPGPAIRAGRDLEDPAQARKVGGYGPTLEGQTRRLLDEMDVAGIDTAVLMAMDYDYTGEKLRVQHWDQLAALRPRYRLRASP